MRRPSRSTRNARKVAARWADAYNLCGEVELAEELGGEYALCAERCGAAGDADGVALWEEARDDARAAAARCWERLRAVARTLPGEWSATSVYIRWDADPRRYYTRASWFAREKAALRRAARHARGAPSTAVVA